MKKILFIITLYNFAPGLVNGQSFTIDNLLRVASLPSKDIDHFMNRNGYVLTSSKLENEVMEASFSVKVKKNKPYVGPKRTINIYLKDDSKYFTLYTSSVNEYVDGQRNLIKSGFFYDEQKDISKDTSILFQRGNTLIQATAGNDDGIPQYSFRLKVKKIPSAVKYAEDTPSI